MIAAIDDPGQREAASRDRIARRVAGLELSTHCGADSPEPVRFLEEIARTAHPDVEIPGAPSAQDIECLRQAAWKYGRQTATETASGKDLIDVLGRLGYV